MYAHVELVSLGLVAAQLFSSCGSQGYSCGAWLRLLRSAGSRAQAPRLRLLSFLALGCVSSRTRDQTHVSCLDRWILYHRATREAWCMYHMWYVLQSPYTPFFFNPIVVAIHILRLEPRWRGMMKRICGVCLTMCPTQRQTTTGSCTTWSSFVISRPKIQR